MVYLKDEPYGTFEGKSIRKFTWTASNGFSVTVINYGAIVTNILVPNKNGELADVVLGFDDLLSYVTQNTAYFGATVGRCANRIAGGKFTLDGATVQLSKNRGDFHLHGGEVGFDKVVWTPTINGNSVTMSYLSKDGEQGYPGDLVSNVTFTVSDDGTLDIEYQATTTKKTVVNLTNHSYFNLGGHESGAQAVYEHFLTVNADKITETDTSSIPTGRFRQVRGTPYDLRSPKKLGDIISAGTDFDNNFCINKYGKDDLTFAASAHHPPSGRYLEVFTDQPGMQLYTSNFLPAPAEVAKPGRNGAGYRRHGAFCFETQAYPDAVNHENFPSAVLRPGQVYRHRVKYVFGADKVMEPFVVSA